MLRLTIMFATLALGAPADLALAKQANSEARQNDVYLRIFDQFTGGPGSEKVVELTQTTTRQMLLINSENKEMEAAYPGYTEAIAQAVRPVIQSYANRVIADYRPRFMEAFRKAFDATEAEEIATFLESPLGRRIREVSFANYDGRAALAAVNQGKQVTSDQLVSDKRITAQKSIQSLAPAERALLRQTRANPTFGKFRAIAPDIQQLMVAMANEPYTEAEMAKGEKLAAAASAAHIAKFSRRKGRR